MVTDYVRISLCASPLVELVIQRTQFLCKKSDLSSRIEPRQHEFNLCSCKSFFLSFVLLLPSFLRAEHAWSLDILRPPQQFCNNAPCRNSTCLVPDRYSITSSQPSPSADIFQRQQQHKNTTHRRRRDAKQRPKWTKSLTPICSLHRTFSTGKKEKDCEKSSIFHAGLKSSGNCSVYDTSPIHTFILGLTPALSMSLTS